MPGITSQHRVHVAHGYLRHIWILTPIYLANTDRFVRTGKYWPCAAQRMPILMYCTVHMSCWAQPPPQTRLQTGCDTFETGVVPCVKCTVLCCTVKETETRRRLGKRGTRYTGENPEKVCFQGMLLHYIVARDCRVRKHTTCNPAFGTCVVLAFGAMPGRCCFLRVTPHVTQLLHQMHSASVRPLS